MQRDWNSKASSFICFRNVPKEKDKCRSSSLLSNDPPPQRRYSRVQPCGWLSHCPGRRWVSAGGIIAAQNWGHLWNSRWYRSFPEVSVQAVSGPRICLRCLPGDIMEHSFLMENKPSVVMGRRWRAPRLTLSSGTRCSGRGKETHLASIQWKRKFPGQIRGRAALESTVFTGSQEPEP